jgi:hypothetical protein
MNPIKLSRRAAALRIDPATAEITWSWGQIMDPYGDDPDLPEEYQCVGRLYFARAAGDTVWVDFNDLPGPIVDALWKRMEAE